MLGTMLSTGFQHIEETHQIRLAIDLRVVQRVTHTRLSRQMHHLGKALFAEQIQQCRLVDDVHFQEAKTRQARKFLEPRLLECYVVVVVEVVDPDHIVAVQAQAPGRMKADKTGSAGDENRHEAFSLEDASSDAVMPLKNHACFMFCFRS